ncbi:hypothetical protein BD413DRAFT_136551 [Trametes elegans]|nr:hypothetical protein BD413DRAFT_136551 [Trametes elegans]
MTHELFCTAPGTRALSRCPTRLAHSIITTISSNVHSCLALHDRMLYLSSNMPLTSEYESAAVFCPCRSRFAMQTHCASRNHKEQRRAANDDALLSHTCVAKRCGKNSYGVDSTMFIPQRMHAHAGRSAQSMPPTSRRFGTAQAAPVTHASPWAHRISPSEV